ncbi:MAG: hypothetical protein MJ195_01495 [Mycoplasmoidaceae bacterium]|nr:hypothetical protein [Mycoplasmoidaceae bacterium]
MYKKLLLYLTLGFVALMFIFLCISFAPGARLAMQILCIIFSILSLICLMLYLFYKPTNKPTTPTPTTPAAQQ